MNQPLFLIVTLLFLCGCQGQGNNETRAISQPLWRVTNDSELGSITTTTPTRTPEGKIKRRQALGKPRGPFALTWRLEGWSETDTRLFVKVSSRLNISEWSVDIRSDQNVQQTYRFKDPEQADGLARTLQLGAVAPEDKMSITVWVWIDGRQYSISKRLLPVGVERRQSPKTCDFRGVCVRSLPGAVIFEQ